LIQSTLQVPALKGWDCLTFFQKSGKAGCGRHCVVRIRSSQSRRSLGVCASFLGCSVALRLFALSKGLILPPAQGNARVPQGDRLSSPPTSSLFLAARACLAFLSLSAVSNEAGRLMRLCSKYGEPHSRGHRSYCKACHAAYTRSWRKLHPLAFDREKDNARSYAGVYKRKGKLIPQPCEACADEAVQMHHDDYSKPLEVRWLCAPCHRKFHVVTRETNKSARPKTRPFVFSDMAVNSS
jgi:hypothetical protein